MAGVFHHQLPDRSLLQLVEIVLSDGGDDAGDAVRCIGCTCSARSGCARDAREFACNPNQACYSTELRSRCRIIPAPEHLILHLLPFWGPKQARKSSIRKAFVTAAWAESKPRK
eukprot:2426126-Pleurochrysis_carterae.AAC.2